MIPTFVFGWPTGQEKGDFLALDLGEYCGIYAIFHAPNILMRKHFIIGGTNLRVCLVTLQGEGKFEISQTKYRLTEEQKQDDGQKLFDFCAECLNTFVETNTGESEGQLKPGQSLPLGFTVSHSLVKRHSELLNGIQFSYPCS